MLDMEKMNSEIKKLNDKYEIQWRENLLSELRMIRRLLDKSGRFEEEKDRQINAVVEEANKGGREKAESTPQATPQQILEFDPEKLEWEHYTAKSGKETWRHPFQGQKIQFSDDYKGLRDAILSVQKMGRRYFSMQTYFYWLGTDQATIYRRPQRKR